MANKFVVVGNKAYRDAMDAVQDPAFVAGAPVAEFPNAKMLNEFFKVSKIAQTDSGLVVAETCYAVDAEAVAELVQPSDLVQLVKISIFPRRDAKPRVKKASEAPAENTALAA